jgi:hypothetical protein
MELKSEDKIFFRSVNALGILAEFSGYSVKIL